jgi:signal transduction histidine kinase
MLPSKLARFADRIHFPRRTVRLRLTLVYGALFLVSGAALLAITYLLVRESTGPFLVALEPGIDVSEAVEGERIGLGEGSSVPSQLPEQLQAQVQELQARANRQHESDLHQLLVQSGTALGLMAVISVGLGWLMAGRVLRPLRTMTATARRISAQNLHERLALEGPSDELKSLSDTIDELLARLEAAFEAQRRFVANASHELRTPLAMMRTSLDVAAGKPGPKPRTLSALESKLREGLDRAERLIESFLTLARAQQGALPERTTVSLPQIVSSAIARRADAVAERRIEIRVDLRPADATGSRTLLSQMVENVIDNAIRHNAPSGWVSVETGIQGDVVRLVVESGGEQLTDDDVQELVKPFSRVAAERTSSGGGLGLGLSIVSAIAHAHNGGLALRARARGGLRAVIELPSARQGLGAERPA